MFVHAPKCIKNCSDCTVESIGSVGGGKSSNDQLPILTINQHNIVQNKLDWVPVTLYAPEFVDTTLDIPMQPVDKQFFAELMRIHETNNLVYDLILTHQIIQSGQHNRFGL